MGRRTETTQTGRHLVVSLVGLSPSEPDLVLSELTSDVGNHFLDVDALARPIIT